ncbi:MAG TPA: 2-hydroxychromene-2-carboxylate isomerase [Hyphomicrobiaceae bacterium]|nr:2-hydroxychromene-2-carboxylate isomerase [Hyphomicrobiaceae bacterium]
MTVTIDYYYAVISGFAYLGEAELRRIAASSGATLVFKPVDIATVFAASETTAPARQSAMRRAYRDLELLRWAQRRGLPLNVKPKYWPAPTVPATRLVLAMQNLGFDPGPLSSALLKAVWVEDRNIADPNTLRSIVEAVTSQHSAAIVERAASADVGSLCEVTTREAIARGVFGSPTYFVDGEMFFGQDRLEFVAEKLGVPEPGAPA